MKAQLVILCPAALCILMVCACSNPSAQAPLKDAGQSDTRKVERLRPLRKLEGHGDIVSALAFSPDGETLASGSHDQRVILWNIQDSKPRRTLEGHHYWISSIAFSSDARILASASNRDMSFLVVEGKAPASSGGPQGEVLLWDVNSGKLKQKLGKAARLNDMSAPDLRELYPATGVAIWPNGRTVAVASYIAYVRFWDINTGQYQPPLLSFRGTIEGIAFSPKGDWFAVARSNEALLYDTAWGKEDSGRSFRAEKGHIRGVLFSPDGAKLVTVGSSEVVVWDVQTGTRVHTLETETDSHAAAFSLDGRFIAVASGIEVLLWDQITGEVIQKITTGESQSPVAFSRDASILATGGQNNEVLLWSVL